MGDILCKVAGSQLLNEDWVNPLTAGAAYSLVSIFYFLLAHQVPPFKHVKDKMWHQPARFEKNWPPFCQIWVIFTHSKLWIASASHNFKWVEIQILRLKGWCPQIVASLNRGGFSQCVMRLQGHHSSRQPVHHYFTGGQRPRVVLISSSHLQYRSQLIPLLLGCRRYSSCPSSISHFISVCVPRQHYTLTLILF